LVAFVGQARRIVSAPGAIEFGDPSRIAAIAYFRNNTVNLLNLHYGIHSLALSGGGAFFLVFLLQSDVSAPGVLAALAVTASTRLLVSWLLPSDPV
jgi:hypothetical protein